LQAVSVSFHCHDSLHVHVYRDRKVCKYRIDPVAMTSNYYFTAVELNAIWQWVRD